MANHLTLEDRIKIEALLEAKVSVGKIAQQLGKHRSTIYREQNKQGVLSDKYDAIIYQEQASKNMARNQEDKCPSKETIQLIETLILNEQWSPEQISCWLIKQNRETASHTWIYKHIKQDKALGGELHNHLRHGGNYIRGHKPYQGQIKNRIGIELRPEIINQRQRSGDYEIDLIVGPKNQGAILTMIDRLTRECKLEKLEDKTASHVKTILVQTLPKHVKSITSDNGTEFSYHEEISEACKLNYYFAHPYASYERGTIENLNGLIRQYIPKGTCFDNIDNTKLKLIENKLNNRPRKVLDFLTPIEYSKLIHNVSHPRV